MSKGLATPRSWTRQRPNVARRIIGQRNQWGYGAQPHGQRLLKSAQRGPGRPWEAFDVTFGPASTTGPQKSTQNPFTDNKQKPRFSRGAALRHGSRCGGSGAQPGGRGARPHAKEPPAGGGRDAGGSGAQRLQFRPPWGAWSYGSLTRSHARVFYKPL